MSTTLTVRLDDRTQTELDQLLSEGFGPNRNAIVRQAIHQTLRAHIEERLRRSSKAIMADPGEQQRLAELTEDMDDLRAW